MTKEQVKHVAGLAKLKITDDEAEKYSIELSKILGYIDQLKEVDTAGKQIDIDQSGLVNRTRADKAVAWDEGERQAALQQAEMTNNNLVKVPKII